MILRHTTSVPGEQASDRLVVFVHGWGGKLFSSKDVVDTIRAELKDADLLAPTYRGHVAANTDPLEIAEALSECIEQAVKDRQRRGGPYRDIILIGYSLGSLIARKAYVFARGQVQDSSTPYLSPHRTWPELVSRIILLAGVNRGWSMKPKPKHVSWLIWLVYFLLYPLTAIIPAGRLIRSFQRGMPFVANLRIQWQNLEQQGSSLPLTIQLLGRQEDLVSLQDNIDIQFCRRFVFLSVPETGHWNAMNFHEPQLGARRRELFLTAMLQENLQGDELSIPIMDDRTEREVGAEQAEVRDVVFVMHGIRDFGHWTKRIRDCIDRIASDHKRRVFVNTAAYTRFPMTGFLFTISRRAKTQWFMDRYSEAYARYPRAQFHFIGHSNGTYLLATALRRYAACHFDRVAFAGSVVPRDFPWDEIVQSGRLRSLRNDLASADWVVAIFPRSFEQVRELLRLPMGDIGTGGVFGFLDTEGNRQQVAYVEGGHSAAIQPANHASLVRYVLGLDVVPRIDEQLKVTDHIAPWVSCCSAICAFIGLLLATLPIALSAMVTYAWYGLATGKWNGAGLGAWLDSLSWYPASIPAALVAVLLAWLLSTV